jgi:hypothetical protein
MLMLATGISSKETRRLCEKEIVRVELISIMNRLFELRQDYLAQDAVFQIGTMDISRALSSHCLRLSQGMEGPDKAS